MSEKKGITSIDLACAFIASASLTAAMPAVAGTAAWVKDHSDWSGDPPANLEAHIAHAYDRMTPDFLRGD